MAYVESSGERYFSYMYNSVRFVFRHYKQSKIFFSVGISLCISLKTFFSLKTSLPEFFSLITHTHLKRQVLGLYIFARGFRRA